MKRKLVILLVLGMCAGAHAFGSESETFTIPGDTTTARVDTASLSPQDSVRQLVPRKLAVVKREFSYRQQVGLALGMMAFIAFMMTTAQSWNPR